MVELPQARSIEVNPSQERLRELTLERMPRVTVTEFGNLNYQAEVTSRLSNSTFFIADHEIHKNRIPRAEAEEWARLQDEHIASQDMLLIEGRVGPDPSLSTPSRLMIEAGGANIAGMQAQLFFPPAPGGEPQFTVIYTPSLPAPGKPD